MFKNLRRTLEPADQPRWEFTICYADYRGSYRYCCSLLPEVVVYEKGLPEAAIVGFFGNNNMAPTAFEQNELFVADFHEFIAKSGTYSAPIQQEAYNQQEGFIYLMDQRQTVSGEEALPENIIGAFEVKGGKIGGYIRNQDHRLFTASGFFDPGPEFRLRFLNYLMKSYS